MGIPLSDVFAPHYCCSCGEIGAVLCEYCKYDIVSETFAACLVCEGLSGQQDNLCTRCKPAFTRAWCVGSRDSALRPLIDAYKFERARAVHDVLVDMLDKTLPTLPSDVQVVPIPTITPHRRTRGYGHVELVAKRFADRRGLAYTEIVQRHHNHVQRGLGRRERIAQAKETYMVTTPAKGTYLLLDDVYTTGATLEYASRALRAAGATDVWVAALSRQTLEK